MPSLAGDMSVGVAHEPARNLAGWVIIGLALAAALVAALFVLFPDAMTAVGAGLFGFLAQQKFVLLFLTMAGGYAIAKLSVNGISLGATAGTLLLALAVSLWAGARHGIEFELPDFVGSLFFSLFMFAVGMKVGPQFLVGLRQGAKDFILLGCLVPLLAAGLLGAVAGARCSSPGMRAATRDRSQRDTRHRLSGHVCHLQRTVHGHELRVCADRLKESFALRHGECRYMVAAIELLAQVVKNGVVVVRSTRVPTGIVLRNNEVDDDKLGFVASGELNAPKSRVLLQLALTKTKSPKEVQRMFNEY